MSDSECVVTNVNITCKNTILMKKNASAAKCLLTELAGATFNYCSSIFQETVIELGAVPLCETTGVLQFAWFPLKALLNLCQFSTADASLWDLVGTLQRKGWDGSGCCRHHWGILTKLYRNAHTPPSTLPPCILTKQNIHWS